MLLDFFGLEEQPFGAAPNPKYLFWSNSHREALASLYHGIKTDPGFMTLVAPPGMGKTTLLFKLLEYLRVTFRTSFLFQTQCSSIEFLRYLLADLGCESGEQDQVELNTKLNRILMDCAQAKKGLVLIIDEAQNLASPVFETVRLLSNFETPGHKLMQIVISGQSKLAEKLAHPDLYQLRQRISIARQLNNLSPLEVGKYIEHRLRVAGYQGHRLFESQALALITGASKGVPRVINSLCFNSLSLAFAHREKRIDASILREVISDMDLSLLSPPGSSTSPLRGAELAAEEAGLQQALRINRWTSTPAGEYDIHFTEPDMLSHKQLQTGSQT